MTLLKVDINEMSMREHLYYWMLPILVLGILMVFYFSGVPQLVEIVCPTENWEWGILENIQLLIILGIFSLSVYSAMTKQAALQKVGFGFIAFFALFVFLEEIDYGAHFNQLLYGEKRSLLRDLTGVGNIHNQGNNARIFKRSVYGIMALLFVISPFLNSRKLHPIIQYLIPKPRIVIVAILAIVSDLVPRLLVDLEIFEDGGLGTNIGEFSEVMVYTIFLIYLIQIVFYKKWPDNAPSNIRDLFRR